MGKVVGGGNSHQGGGQSALDSDFVVYHQSSKISIKGDSKMATILGNNTDLVVTNGMNVIDATDDYFTGKGALTLYADYRDIIFNLVGAANMDTFISASISLAANHIDLGNGNMVVFGNVRDIVMNVTGGDASDGLLHETLITGTTITMAGNFITAGSGNNVVHGNMRDFIINVEGGDASGGPRLGQA